jgi:sodium/potassium-transporting ATPase subunit alpha
MDSKGVKPIDPDFVETFTAAYERFGSCGERVLGFAFKNIEGRNSRLYHDDEKQVDKEGFIFCGLVSLVDPPRPGVKEAVEICRTAGIKVTMVTGDHPLTAEAIARKVGIITLPTRLDIAHEEGVPLANIPMSDPRVMAAVVTGSDIPAMSEEDWDVVLSKKECVFARTSPQQKLQLVTHYQRREEIVAVTGDGVNDAPALKQAQIGVAMGSPAASEVARDAADIILLDDNFASIVHAIEEGRTVFDNLKKTIAYTLAHLWPELLPVLLNLAFSFPLALNGLMILTIDLLTEQGPAISLAYEAPESQIMQRPPRNLKTQRLVSGPSLFYSYVLAGGAEMLICMFAFFLVFIHNGIPIHRLTFSLDHKYFATPPVYLQTNGTWVTESGDSVPDFVTSSGRHINAEEQWKIAFEASSAWYMTLIVCQVWHLFNCRTRTESIFTHGCGNIVSIFGCTAAIGIMVAVVYIPAFQVPSAFASWDLHGLYYAPQFIFLAYITTYNETVKWFVRNRPKSWIARYFGW